MKKLNKFGKFIGRHQLSSFVIVALLITGLMTGVSLWLYRASGAFRLDLSRPGYEQVRGEVTDNDQQQDKPFSPSGALTTDVIKDFNARLDKQQTNLSKMGDFGGDTLSDENLGLTAGEQ